MTYTYVRLEVSLGIYEEIAGKLREAGYDQCFHDDGVIDMHGIALTTILRPLPLTNDRPQADPLCVCGHPRSAHEPRYSAFLGDALACMVADCACGPGCIHGGFVGRNDTSPLPPLALVEDRPRAPVQAPHSLGRPPGTIAWDEHEEAWAQYAAKYELVAQSAEHVAACGGFSYAELVGLLGHEPTTWRPR